MNYSIHFNEKLVTTQVKTLNKNVQRYIRCIKSLNQAYSVTSKTELSEVTGASRMYLQRNTKNIEAYYLGAEQPSTEDMKWFNDKSLDYYLLNITDIREGLGAIVGYLMKHCYGLLGHLRQVSAIKLAGGDILKLTVAIKSRKHNSGTPIQANSKAVKNLTKHNKIAWIDKMFIRTNGYYAGHQSKLWKTTKLMDNILAESITIFFDKISNKKVNFILNNTKECYTNRVTYSSICCNDNVTPLLPIKYVPYQLPKLSLSWQIKPFAISSQQVQTLCLSSILHIISNSIVFKNGHFIVSLNHTSSTNPSFGRSYNIFTRLHSNERKALGYTNYDISCALQTISLQLIQATNDDYPLLTHYTKDISFKKALREDIATDLNISIVDVKAKLTAFANGGVSGINKHPIYKQFQEESDRLRREVLTHTAKYTPHLLEQSIVQSKKKLPEDIDWFGVGAEDSQSLARDKASVYFFVWTYYERLIRKSMLTVLTDGIEVHDAVYSKMDVSTDFIEATIFESTGFGIIIEKE